MLANRWGCKRVCVMELSEGLLPCGVYWSSSDGALWLADYDVVFLFLTAWHQQWSIRDVTHISLFPPTHTDEMTRKGNSFLFFKDHPSLFQLNWTVLTGFENNLMLNGEVIAWRDSFFSNLEGVGLRLQSRSKLLDVWKASTTTKEKGVVVFGTVPKDGLENRLVWRPHPWLDSVATVSISDSDFPPSLLLYL